MFFGFSTRLSRLGIDLSRALPRCVALRGRFLYAGLRALDGGASLLICRNETHDSLATIGDGAHPAHVLVVGLAGLLLCVLHLVKDGFQALLGHLRALLQRLHLGLGILGLGKRHLRVRPLVARILHVGGAIGGNPHRRVYLFLQRTELEPDAVGLRRHGLGGHKNLVRVLVLLLRLLHAGSCGRELHVGGLLRFLVLHLGGKQARELVARDEAAGFTDLRLDGLGSLGGLRLPCQWLELSFQLLGEVGEAIEVGLHAGELALRLLLAAFMLQHAGGFFYIGTPILGAGFEDLGDFALPHDNVHLPTDAGIAEQLLDIHEARLGAVDLVLACTVAEHAPGDGHFRVLDGQRAVIVINSKGDLRSAERLAAPGTGEDDIFHLPAA